MVRVRLSKGAKVVFRYVASKGKGRPLSMDEGAYLCALYELERYGFVRVLSVEGGCVEGVRLTRYGASYLACNPSLRSPVDWKWIVTTVISAIAALLSALALLSVVIVYKLTS